MRRKRNRLKLAHAEGKKSAAKEISQLFFLHFPPQTSGEKMALKAGILGAPQRLCRSVFCGCWDGGSASAGIPTFRCVRGPGDILHSSAQGGGRNTRLVAQLLSPRSSLKVHGFPEINCSRILFYFYFFARLKTGSTSTSPEKGVKLKTRTNK